MTRVVGKGGARAVILEPEADAHCELCGIVAELRPYGPRGARICFACAMKDEKMTKRQFARYVLGEETH